MTIQQEAPDDASIAVSSSPLPDDSCIHGNDHFDRFLDWIPLADGSAMTTKSFAKRLPNIVQDIRDGVCSTDDFTEAVLVGMLHKFLTKQFPVGHPLSREPQDDLLDLWMHTCATQAVPTRKTGEVYQGFLGDFYGNLRQGLLTFFFTNTPQEDHDGGIALLVKKAFGKTCTTWEGCLSAKTFRGKPPGAFRRSCKLFDAPCKVFGGYFQDCAKRSGSYQAYFQLLKVKIQINGTDLQ